MSLNEIENTLNELKTRHPNLDETMLVTLLNAGGWEEKMIRDAVLVFNESKTKKPISQNNVAQPITETENILPETIGYDHALMEHNLPAGEAGEEEIKPTTETPIKVEEKTTEPQSLIEPIVEEKTSLIKENEVPHNLSVRPFESTEGVWPFSRYKDVFFGDVMPKSKEELKDIDSQKLNQTTENNQNVGVVHLKRVPLSNKDEKLIVTATSMLVLVIILLIYMSANGRL